MMFKRIAAAILVCLLITVFASCGGNTTVSPDSGGKTSENSPSENTVSENTAKENSEQEAPSQEAPSQEDTAPETQTDSPDAKTIAYDTYKLLAQKLTAQTDGQSQFDIDFTAHTEMTIAGESMGFDMGGNIKMKTVGGKVQYSMFMDMGEMGSMEMYSDGNKAYYVYGEETAEIDLALIEEQIASSVNLPEFEREAIKSCETTTVPEGIKTVAVLDGRALSSFVMEAMGSELGELFADTQMNISDVTMVIVTDDAGNPKSMDMAMTMSMVIEEDPASVSISYEYIFNKLGSGVDIDLSGLTS